MEKKKKRRERKERDDQKENVKNKKSRYVSEMEVLNMTSGYHKASGSCDHSTTL